MSGDEEHDELPRVPSAWVHVDLQRLRAKLEMQRTSARVNELALFRRLFFRRVDVLEKAIQKHRSRAGRVAKELEEITAELESDTAALDVTRRLLDGTRNQAFYQKSTSRNYLAPTVVPASPRGPTAPPPSLSLYAFSAFPICAVGTVPLDDEAVQSFLKLCAPLLQWSGEERTVKPPFFFDEPCLLERAADEPRPPPRSSSPAAALNVEEAAPVLACHNAACAYWHEDQLAHVKMAAWYCVDWLDSLWAGREETCGVTRLTARLSRQVAAAESISVVCALLCEALQTCICAGLYRNVRDTGRGTTADSLTPTLKGAAALQMAPPRADLIRSEEERQRWQELMQRQASEESQSSSSDGVSSAVAAEGLQQRFDALSWRCLLASVSDTAQRQWLARQGIQLFPNCPPLHLEYVLSCARMAQSDAAVVTLVEAAMASCRTLSAQAAASVIAGLDCGQYATSVARHVGYIVAVVAVRCAAVGAQAALDFLTPLLATSDEPGLTALLLLPAARQNLALVTVALRRDGCLRAVEHLPLAAVSDVVWELATTDGGNPAENGRETIYASLKFVNAFKRERFDAHLTQACAGALQLSLLRTFSHRLPYMERVAEKTVPESALAQALIYCEHVSAVGQQQSVEAAVQVAEAFASADGATCILNLLLISQLRLWGSATQLSAVEAVAALCAAEHLTLDVFDAPRRLVAVCAEHCDVPAVEWVAAYVLHVVYGSKNSVLGSGEEGGNAVWEALASFPVEVLAVDLAAAALYFHVLLRQCGIAQNAARFLETVHRCLRFFREAHTHMWSPLDASYAELVGLPHYLSLMLYAEVPFIVGVASAENTYAWRCLVLSAAAELGVLHPLLQTDETTP